jgi:hypothetical protein
MNKQLPTFLFFLFSFLWNSSFSQEVLVGGGFLFGTLTDDFGVNMTGEYVIDESWAAEAHATIFFVENSELFGIEVKRRLWMIDFDAHYSAPLGMGKIYGLAGLNLTTYKEKAEVSSPLIGEVEGSVSDTDIGLNIGGGYILDLGEPVRPFGDIRYVISGSDQFIVRLGIKYAIGL